MASLLGQLTRATNVLSQRLEERIAETGMYASEFLVLRTAMLDAEASTAQIRRALGLRDSAFSDVIRRAVERGYVSIQPYPSDGRTRRIAFSIPGKTTIRIAADIYWELEAALRDPGWRLQSFDRLRELGDAIEAIPRSEQTEDGLPAATA